MNIFQDVSADKSFTDKNEFRRGKMILAKNRL